jgi:CBS domain containing-hemolysin-like protein
MDDADRLSILVIVLCLAGSMFFSGSETAITSYGDRRARRLYDEGGKDGRTMSLWVERPVWVLSTILLGNNITNTLLGATATALAIRHLQGGEYGEWAVPVAVFFSTGVLLIFGEIVPKAMGRVYSRKLTLPILSVLTVFGRLSYPVTWLLTRVTELVIGRAMPDESSASLGRITSGEIGYLVKEAQREGSIPADKAKLLQSVFRFADKDVRDIMVPVDKVTSIDQSWDFARIREQARLSGHSRLPVYVGDVDNITGVLHIKSLVGQDGDGPDPEALASMMRRPFFVSESLLIQDLLRRFQEQRVHLAIVTDDAGATVGVVTLEDVLEQIVGQIFDETDRPPVASPAERLGIYYFDGQESLARVEEALGLELEEVDGVDSIGDLLTRLAGQIPIASSVFVWEGARFKVLAADGKHISRVSVERVEPVEDEDD